MSLVIFMRHAKAVRDHEAPSDQARGLTQRGRENALAAAQEMRTQGLSVATVAASTSARTMATARIVIDEATPPPRLAPEDALYLAEPEAIWNISRHLLDTRGLLVVGHNPGLEMLVTAWINRASDRSRLGRALAQGLPTAAWAAFDVDNEPIDSVTPRLVGGWSPHGL